MNHQLLKIKIYKIRLTVLEKLKDAWKIRCLPFW